MKLSSMVFLGLLVSASAIAAEQSSIQCTQGGQNRSVSIKYENESAKVPCSVLYKKGDDEAKSIFNSAHKTGFCEEKMQAFVDKLKGMGWDCK
jgi:hypothetical protein